MLNMLWAFMILIGVFTAVFTGRMPEITNGGINSAAEAVMVCIKMAGAIYTNNHTKDKPQYL